MSTNPRTYTALEQGRSLKTTGKLRGNLNVRELREAVRALAGLVFVLTQFAKDDLGRSSDAIDQALIVAEGLVADLEVKPGQGGGRP